MDQAPSRFEFVPRTKQCGRCKEQKLRKDFYGDRNRRGGCDSICRQCRLEERVKHHKKVVNRGRAILAEKRGAAFVAAREIFCARVKQRLDEIDEVLSWPDVKEPEDEEAHVLGPRERDMMMARRDEACMLIDKLFRMNTRAIASAPTCRYNSSWLHTHHGSESDCEDMELSEESVSSVDVSSLQHTERTEG